MPTSDPSALGVSADVLVQRARALRSLLREQQAEAEQRGHHSEELHERFLEAGFYSILVPRMFGGLELDLATYYRVMMEISRGDPGTGWCLTLGSSHALMAGSHFSEEAQREMFVNGWFAAPHTAVGACGILTRVDGGFRVTGRWEYASGIPFSPWFMGMATISQDDPVSPGKLVHIAVPRSDVTVLDNWGGGRTLGLQSSGSNSVVIDDAFMLDRFAVDITWHEGFDPVAPTPGAALHGNPMYLGRAHATYHTSIAAVQVGTARAALDEYEDQLRNRKNPVPPWGPRIEDPMLLSHYGHALTLTEAAEALIVAGMDRYAEYCARWAEHGEPFDMPKAVRLFAMAQQAGALAAEATELLFRTAGTSAAAGPSVLNRYFRDTAMYRGHQSSQRETYWARFSGVRLGIADSLLGLDD
jgi:3-hydroxy-9,10-secoandrosta-1,3,5(10)-triene-9,17-dione monooxygenase